MVYYSRRQCSSPDDCAEGAHSQTLSPTVERVFNTIASSSAPDDHKLLRAYIVLALNLILFAVLARAGYRALTRPRAPPARHHRRNSVAVPRPLPGRRAVGDILISQIQKRPGPTPRCA